MAQSITRKLSKGNLLQRWNENLKRYDFYRRTSRGGYCLTNPFVAGSTLGPTLHKNQVINLPDVKPTMLEKSINKVKNLFKKKK